MAGFSFSSNPATSSSSSSSSPFSFSLSSSSQSQSQSQSQYAFSLPTNPSSSSSLFGASFGAPASSTTSFGFSFTPSSSSSTSSSTAAAATPSFGFGATSAAATGFGFGTSSSSAAVSPFGGANLFGSTSSAAATTASTTTTNLFGSNSSSPFGTSTVFWASSASNANTTANSPFSSGLFGSSSSSSSSSLSSGTTFGATPSLTSSTSTSATAPSFPNLFGSSSSSTTSPIPNLFGASSSSSTTSPIPNLFGASSSSSTTPSFPNIFGTSSASLNSSSTTTTTTQSAAPSFSFSGSAPSAPSFSFTNSSTSGASTAAVSSSSSAPSSSPATSFSFANLPGLQSSSGFASSFKTPSTTTTAAASATVSASKTPSAFGVPSSAAATTASTPSFKSPATVVASTGTTSSFGFPTSSKTTSASTLASQSQSTPALSMFGVPASTATTSTVTTTTAQTSSALVVSSSSGTTSSVSPAVVPTPKLPSEITGKTVEEIIKEWNGELQERTSKFRKQANAIAEWDKRILQNRDVLKLEAEVAKVVETQSNLERQLELIETHQQEVDKSLQSVEEEAERIYKDEHGLLLDDEAASTRDAMYEQAEFIERELEQMTEQIKSVIQTLNANQAGELEVTDDMTPLDVVVRQEGGPRHPASWRAVCSSTIVSTVEPLVTSISRAPSLGELGVSSKAGDDGLGPLHVSPISRGLGGLLSQCVSDLADPDPLHPRKICDAKDEIVVRSPRVSASSSGCGKHIEPLVSFGLSASMGSQSTASGTSAFSLATSSFSAPAVFSDTAPASQRTFGTIRFSLRSFMSASTRCVLTSSPYGAFETTSAALTSASMGATVSTGMSDFPELFGSSSPPISSVSLGIVSSPPISVFPGASRASLSASQSVGGSVSALAGTYVSSHPRYRPPPLPILDTCYSLATSRSVTEICESARDGCFSAFIDAATALRRSADELASRDQELDTLRAQLAERDAENAALREQVGSFTERDTEIAGLEEQVRSLTARVAECLTFEERVTASEEKEKAACQSRRDLLSMLPRLFREIFGHPDVARVLARYSTACQRYGKYSACVEFVSSCPFAPLGSLPAIDEGALAELIAARAEVEGRAFPILERLVADLDISADALLELVMSHP